jgi:nitrogenase molybdenum-cofactor synthesis protein NifE
MINVARKMEERYGIPVFEGSFYGIGDTSDSLREIARLLIERGADPELMERTEAVIAREEARAWAGIEPYKARLAGKRVLLITGGVKSWSVVAALQEAGMEVVGTSVKKSTDEDKQRIKEIMGEDAHMIDDMTPREMYRMLKEAEADIMLSGGRSQFVALKAAMPWMDINQERHLGFAGYHGMAAMVAEIDRTIANPMWAQVRAPAPWDAAGESWQARALEEAPAVPDPGARMVCQCKGVSAGAITDAVAGGCDSPGAVMQATGASSGCGACKPFVRKAVDAALAEQAVPGREAA